jgi:hypothetical protein
MTLTKPHAALEELRAKDAGQPHELSAIATLMDERGELCL